MILQEKIKRAELTFNCYIKDKYKVISVVFIYNNDKKVSIDLDLSGKFEIT